MKLKAPLINNWQNNHGYKILCIAYTYPAMTFIALIFLEQPLLKATNTEACAI